MNPPKNGINIRNPDPYYDPTYEARLNIFPKEIMTVPVAMERDL